MRTTDIVITRQNASARVALADAGWVPEFILSGLKSARDWMARFHQRRALSLLDDRMLKDIGLNRFDVAREFDKPFWQA